MPREAWQEQMLLKTTNNIIFYYKKYKKTQENGVNLIEVNIKNNRMTSLDTNLMFLSLTLNYDSTFA